MWNHQLPKELNTQPAEPKPSDKPENIIETSTFKWGYKQNIQISNLKRMFQPSATVKTVYWKNNIFLLPAGKSGRCFIDERARLIDTWIRDSPLKNIALKAIMIMPSLLLQNQGKVQRRKTIKLSKGEFNYGLTDIWLNS